MGSMRQVSLAGSFVNGDGRAFVIAEAGNNHGGSPDTAVDMIRLAAWAGVHAIKFQTRNNRLLYTNKFFAQPYNSENALAPTYGAHREMLEMPREEYPRLQDEATQSGVAFFSTPFDEDSADFLETLDVPFYKIASGDLTNLRLLRHVARFGKPMIVSTGGGTLDNVRQAHDETAPHCPVVLLQCTAAYPCPPEAMNLRVIEVYLREFPDAVIGLSDHQHGIDLAVAAYVLGARVFEKHFTLDHTAKGTDHAFSLEPSAMAAYCKSLNRAFVALGGEKDKLPIEGGALHKMGKALYAARALSSGIRLSDEDVAVKSPADGMAASRIDEVVGAYLKEPLGEDEPLSSVVLG